MHESACRWCSAREGKQRRRSKNDVARCIAVYVAWMCLWVAVGNFSAFISPTANPIRRSGPIIFSPSIHIFFHFHAASCRCQCLWEHLVLYFYPARTNLRLKLDRIGYCRFGGCPRGPCTMPEAMTPPRSCHTNILGSNAATKQKLSHNQHQSQRTH